MGTRLQLLLAIPLAVAAGAALAAAAFFIAGPERVWERFGPADLGAVDFASLQRRDTPNDALACRADFCAAQADMPSPVFAVPGTQLFRIVEAAVAEEPRLVRVHGDPARGELRYVQRSRVMRYPDTINLKVAALPEGGSTVLIYSRSQLGRGDLGVNRARIERWIGLIEAAAQK